MAPSQRKEHNDANLVRGNRQASTPYPLQQGIKLTFWRAFAFANTQVGEDFELKKQGKHHTVLIRLLTWVFYGMLTRHYPVLITMGN